jgi:hypothetical protein
MISLEMSLEIVVVFEDGWPVGVPSSVADMASLVLLSDVDEELIVGVVALLAESTKRMTTETALVQGSIVFISQAFMSRKLFLRKEFMFMGKDFLVFGTKIAHDSLVDTLDMSMEVKPS